MTNRDEAKASLTSRRVKITPEQAGLVHYSRNRRVAGLRRSEVADLPGASVEHYAQLERGNLSGPRRACSTCWPVPRFRWYWHLHVKRETRDLMAGQRDLWLVEVAAGGPISKLPGLADAIARYVLPTDAIVEPRARAVPQRVA